MKLPNEIIFNILSYFPLRSLYKFKCVCKLCNTLFMNPSFLYLYKIHTMYDDNYKYLVSLDFEFQDRRGFRTICHSTHELAIDRNTRQTPHTNRIKSYQLRDVFPILIWDDHGAVKLVSIHEDEKK
ncbi:hypothetical protein H5410_029708 [Solanum commersonii]|uniref:F-box domain-containing protein n=1 Tax=Solanum commersonii TaxID=4109 RepID=A0A9J5YDP2_SOLCO|nr:hypothetical protein H5410_029708 [Solanum commersonii]